PDAPSLDLTGWCREAFGAPLVLENDANAAMIGEWRFGAGQDHDHAVMMIFGTGVGVSAITDGRLLRGAHGYGGVLGGHQTINLHGRLCPCGNMGCVETEASTWVLQELPLPEGAS